MTCESSANGTVASAQPLTISATGASYAWSGYCSFGDTGGQLRVSLTRGAVTVRSAWVPWRP